MKKLIFTLAVPALLFSCGGGDDYCGCAKEAQEMAKKDGAEGVKASAEKMKECTKMLEGKSPEELVEMGKDCTDLMKK